MRVSAAETRVCTTEMYARATYANGGADGEGNRIFVDLNSSDGEGNTLAHRMERVHC